MHIIKKKKRVGEKIFAFTIQIKKFIVLFSFKRKQLQYIIYIIYTIIIYIIQ